MRRSGGTDGIRHGIGMRKGWPQCYRMHNSGATFLTDLLRSWLRVRCLTNAHDTPVGQDLGAQSTVDMPQYEFAGAFGIISYRGRRAARERNGLQDGFTAAASHIIIATNASGMVVAKADVLRGRSTLIGRRVVKRESTDTVSLPEIAEPRGVPRATTHICLMMIKANELVVAGRHTGRNWTLGIAAAAEQPERGWARSPS